MTDTRWWNGTDDLINAKKELGIKDDTDNILLNDYGDKANRKIDNLVFSLLDEIPTTDAEKITEELKQAAILDVAKRYKIKIKSFEAAKQYESDFNDIIKSVENRAKATPTGRTRIVAVSQDYDTEDDILFSQRIFR